MQAKCDAIYNIGCGRAYLVPPEWVEGKPRTFHTVKDLPCDLDCRDDRREPLVKEYDILNTPLEIVILTMMRRLTAALRAASEAPWTAMPQSACSDIR